MYPHSLLEVEVQRLRLEELERKWARERHLPIESRPRWRNLRLMQKLSNYWQRNRRVQLRRTPA